MQSFISSETTKEET